MTEKLSARRRTGLRHHPDVRQLGAFLAVGVGLALLTGPDGSQNDFGRSFKELPSGRLVLCLLVAVAVWALFVARRHGTLSRIGLAGVVSAPARARARFATLPGARWTSTVLVLGAAIAIPPFLSNAWQEVLVTQTGIYILLAIGLNVVVGWAGLLDLGYVAFFAIGAYTTAYFTDSLPVHPPFVLNPFYAMFFAIAACCLAGVILGAPTLRLRGDYLAIVTLGFGEIVRLTALNAEDTTNGSRGATGIPHPSIHIGPINFDWTLAQLPYWYLLLVLICVVVFMFNRLEHSRIGRAWAAIREDEVAAQANGVRTFRLKLLAFAIGASTSGVAGVLYASKVSFIAPANFLLIFSVFVLAYVIFGGMGSITGVILGASLLTIIPEYLRDVVPAPDRPIYVGAILVLMMIYRPIGLLPERRRQLELSTHDTPGGETTAVAPAGSMGGVQK